MKIILKTILLALIVALLAIVAEQTLAVLAALFGHPEIVLDFYSQITWFLTTAAVIEEALKYWVIYFVLKKRFDLRGMRLIFSALLLGFTWGIFEAGLAVYPGQNISPVSALPVVLLHALTAFLMGIFISKSSDPDNPPHIKILVFSILIHLLFNFLAIKLA